MPGSYGSWLAVLQEFEQIMFVVMNLLEGNFGDILVLV